MTVSFRGLLTNGEWRMAIRSWLRYSKCIAMMMHDKMEELGLTQKSAAERIGCSRKYILSVPKGTENLSIGTISKIEYALKLEIYHLYSRVRKKSSEILTIFFSIKTIYSKIITDRVLLKIVRNILYLYGDSLNIYYYLCTPKGIE